MSEPISRLSRLSAILNHLQSGKLITSTFLSEKFDVSIRTIYRDMRALEASGVPIYVIEGKGYRLVEGYTLPPITFTENEANALITAQQIIQQNKDGSLVRHYNESIAKIKAVMRSENKTKSEILENRVVYIKNLYREKTSDNLIQIQSALTNKQVLSILYQVPSRDEPTARDVEPMAIYHTSDNWIMVCWCRLRNDFRDFRLDRILSLRNTSNIFEERDFDLYAYFMRASEHQENYIKDNNV